VREPRQVIGLVSQILGPAKATTSFVSLSGLPRYVFRLSRILVLWPMCTRSRCDTIGLYGLYGERLDKSGDQPPIPMTQGGVSNEYE
jgi:hypothetical protein